MKELEGKIFPTLYNHICLGYTLAIFRGGCVLFYILFVDFS